MKNALQIGKATIPIVNYAISRNAILGITNSGKTYTAKGIAEQLLEAGIPIIVFDAIGVWKHLREPGEGPDAKGFEVVVAGGQEPDLPLTPESAPTIIRAAIKENIPLVIDLYDPNLSKADWRRIVQSSMRVLLHENKGMRHVFLEESAEFVPQRVIDGQTYAEVEKLARMGGNKGVGITLINQRSQELNKAVLELCDNIFLMRQRGKNAVKSILETLETISPETEAEVKRTITKMGQGDVWVFTEDDRAILTRSGKLRSYHPDRKVAKARPTLATDTSAAVARMREELGELLAVAESEDPAALRKRIVSLEKELRTALQASPKVDRGAELFLLDGIDEALDLMGTAIKSWKSNMAKLRETIEKSQSIPVAYEKVSGTGATGWSETVLTGQKVQVNVSRPFSKLSDQDLTPPRQRILNTVWMLHRRLLTPDREMIARWLDIHPNTGSYSANLAWLRGKGYLEGFRFIGNENVIDKSVYQIGIDGVLQVLTWPQRRIVEALIDCEDSGPISREALAAVIGIHPNTGSFSANLARLRSMGVIPERGQIYLTEYANK